MKNQTLDNRLLEGRILEGRILGEVTSENSDVSQVVEQEHAGITYDTLAKDYLACENAKIESWSDVHARIIDSVSVANRIKQTDNSNNTGEHYLGK